jgi:hypothetical protein
LTDFGGRTLMVVKMVVGPIAKSMQLASSGQASLVTDRWASHEPVALWWYTELTRAWGETPVSYFTSLSTASKGASAAGAWVEISRVPRAGGRHRRRHRWCPRVQRGQWGVPGRAPKDSWFSPSAI